MEFGFSLGSNLGDRLAHLREARCRLLETPGARLAAQSPVYETEPVGVKPAYQHLRFLNAVLILESDGAAADWLAAIGRIEAEMGRVRGGDRYAPRTIDIDLLYAGQECIDTGGLIVPHPRWSGRRFVVQPLADVRPDLRLPGAGGSVREVLEQLPPDPAFGRFPAEW
jgi:2-amino-4-hydroxy-6-hydroxymethyldihydropteridine diphosphokinase